MSQQDEVVKVQLRDDHLHRIGSAKPFTALAELVWNALDADAMRVAIDFDTSLLGGVEALSVADNGHGLSPDGARRAFGLLGGSWKAEKLQSQEKGRMLHGKLGEGRFKAFALGSEVTWVSVAEDGDGSLAGVRVTGTKENPGEFVVETLEPASVTTSPGTVVTVTGTFKETSELPGEEVFHRMCGTFGPYLRQYPDVSIEIAGRKVDASTLIANQLRAERKHVKLPSGEVIDLDVEILEWQPEIRENHIYFCDEAGFSLHRTPGHLTAHGLRYSVHARSDFFRRLSEMGGFALEELDSDVQTVLAEVKKELRTYLRRRHAEEAKLRVDEWKSEQIYPYEGEADSEREHVERQLFDIVAANVADYLPGFDRGDRKAKRLQFKLLQQAMQSNPASLGLILSELVELPKAKQDELADLLKDTSLSRIIQASRMVADRLSFLRLLETLVYDHDSKKLLKERSQLHRLLASQTWVFGERYNLVVDDRSLTQTLKALMNSEDRSVLEGGEVLRDDGTVGIVDLVLGRALRPHGTAAQENLVVELKRPKQRVTMDVVNQLDNYAAAIMSEPRFNKLNHSWTFIAVSSDVDDRVKAKATQVDRAEGVIYNQDNYKLIVKTWSEVIMEARAGLDFVNTHLEISPTDAGAARLLQERYAMYFEEGGIPSQRLRDAVEQSAAGSS